MSNSVHSFTVFRSAIVDRARAERRADRCAVEAWYNLVRRKCAGNGACVTSLQHYRIIPAYGRPAFAPYPRPPRLATQESTDGLFAQRRAANDPQSVP